MTESSSSPDHDQRLKVLLKEFFEHFFRCFFPRWAERFDFHEVHFLDKEVFLAPPQGEKRVLDIVARVRIRPDAPPPVPGMTESLALIHIEVESRDSVQPLRSRMFEYYTQLRRDTQLPVLPIGLYLRVAWKASAGMPMRNISAITTCYLSTMLTWGCPRWMRKPTPRERICSARRSVY